MATYLIPIGKKSIDIPVAPGRYNVRVTAEGYKEDSLNVTVGYGETVEVNFGTMSLDVPSGNGSDSGPSERDEERDMSANDPLKEDGGRNTSMVLLAVVAIVALIIFSR